MEDEKDKPESIPIEPDPSLISHEERGLGNRENKNNSRQKMKKNMKA
jgi:hypothetical protein